MTTIMMITTMHTQTMIVTAVPSVHFNTASELYNITALHIPRQLSLAVPSWVGAMSTSQTV